MTLPCPGTPFRRRRAGSPSAATIAPHKLPSLSAAVLLFGCSGGRGESVSYNYGRMYMTQLSKVQPAGAQRRTCLPSVLELEVVRILAWISA